MRNIGVGLLGLGTVGSGVVKALSENGGMIAKKLGAEIEIRRILVRDLNKQRAVQVPRDLLTVEFAQVLSDDSIQIVVDAMGGIEPAREYILQALARGKHVVTANKEVIAKYGGEILATAERQGVGCYFEASVGGGIPIIRPLKECLAANEVQEIRGIINGTTNYILTKMANEGREFSAILREAQEKGYAEPDPTNDVEGFDAAYKLVILASLAFGTPIRFEDISFAGISRISRQDMVWATKLGYTIKLLATATEQEKGLEVWVAPCLIPQEHPLARVNDVYNGIFIKGNLVGELLFTGRGAGDLPTASAVVGDIMAVVRTIVAEQPVKHPCSCHRLKPVLDKEEISSCFYLRVVVSKADVALLVNSLLVQEQIHVTPLTNQLIPSKRGTVIYFTDRIEQRQASKVLNKLKGLPGVKEVSMLRVEQKNTAQAQAADI